MAELKARLPEFLKIVDGEVRLKGHRIGPVTVGRSGATGRLGIVNNQTHKLTRLANSGTRRRSLR